MPVPTRVSLACLIGFVFCGSTACNMVPHQTYMQSQYRTMQLYRQNQTLASERDGLRSRLEIANRRFDNLNSERSALQQRYLNVLNSAKNQKSGPAASCETTPVRWPVSWLIVVVSGID